MTTAVIPRVSALARRDLVIQLSYHFQLFIRSFSIVTSVTMFYFLSRLIGNAEPLDGFRGGYFEFVLLGLVVLGLSQVCVFSFGESVRTAQNDGTLEILLSTATQLPTLLAGTLIVPLLLAAVEAAIYLAFGYALGDLSFTLGAVLLSIPVLLLTLGTFAAVGILSATVIVLTKRGDPFSSLVLQASNLLAGAMFPLALLPGALQALAHLAPAFYGLRATRAVLLADAGFADIAPDLGILLAFNVVMLPAATWLLSRALRIARVTGTLGNR